MTCETSIRTTCPRDCYDSCGIRVVMKGRGIDRVTGDPEHSGNRGSLCGKCTLAYNGVWRDPSVRLKVPLRRTGMKGEGAFEKISWDEAPEFPNRRRSGSRQSNGSLYWHLLSYR